MTSKFVEIVPLVHLSLPETQSGRWSRGSNRRDQNIRSPEWHSLSPPLTAMQQSNV